MSISPRLQFATKTFSLLAFVLFSACPAASEQEPSSSIFVPEESQIGEIQNSLDALNAFIASFRLEIQSDKDNTLSQFESLESSFATANAAANAQEAVIAENAARLAAQDAAIKKINKSIKRLERRLSMLGRSVRSR